VAQQNGFLRMLRFYGSDCVVAVGSGAALAAGATIVTLESERIPRGYYQIDFGYGMALGATAGQFNNVEVFQGATSHGRLPTLPQKGVYFSLQLHMQLNGVDDLTLRVVNPENLSITHAGYICAIRVK
jgi:hypothetical protein